jgi:hypothetical protein
MNANETSRNPKVKMNYKIIFDELNITQDPSPARMNMGFNGPDNHSVKIHHASV